MGYKIGFVNQKGGVGKTTLGITVCTALSQEPFKYKCAFIDCDSQESAIMQRERDVDLLSQDIAYYKAEQILTEKSQKPTEEEIEEESEKYVEAIREKIKEDNVNKFFPYPVFFVELSKLADFVIEIEDEYDFIFMDMPGQAEGSGLSTLIMSLDHAFVPVQSGDFDLNSSKAFIEKLFEFKSYKESRYVGKDFQFILNLSIIFNEIEETLKYRGAISEFKNYYKNDKRISIIPEEYGLTRSVFYKENTSTRISILDVNTSDKSKKKQKERFKVFVTKILNIIQNG